jgi:hypothetical protein
MQHRWLKELPCLDFVVSVVLYFTVPYITRQQWNLKDYLLQKSTTIWAKEKIKSLLPLPLLFNSKSKRIIFLHVCLEQIPNKNTTPSMKKHKTGQDLEI